MAEGQARSESGSTPAVFAGPRERYEVVRKLGEGGFGTTHLARRVRDGHEVVVKQLRMDRMGDWKAFDLFEREAKVLEALEHPNIPAFIDHFQVEEGETLRGLALVQEYVAGRTFAELQRQRPTPDAASMRPWLTRLLEILRHLHELQPPVIHRDISPKNVILRPDGEPVLIDFGTVQNAIRSADTVASTAAGTFGYAAPEQLIGRALPTSDLYGLAMTYLAVATGKEPETLPFSGNRVQVSAALRDHDTHPRLALLLEELTEPDPTRRPKSAAEVLDRLQAIPLAAASPGPGLALAAVAEDSPAARAERAWRERIRRSAAARAPKGTRAIPETEDPRSAAIDDAGTAAIVELGFMEGRLARIDLGSYEMKLLDTSGSQIFHPRIALDHEGRRVLLISFDEGALVVPGSDGTTKITPVHGLPSSMMALTRERGCFAVSPDQKLLACLGDGGIVLFDLQRGGVAQKIEIPDTFFQFAAGLRFVPDGSALLVERLSDTNVVDPKGSTERLEDTKLAVANDGRTVARATETELGVGVVETWVPLKWREKPRTICKLEGKVEQLRFSPSDRALAYEQAGFVTVVDLQSAKVLMKVGDPYRPGAPLEHPEQLAFSADGRRLFAVARCTVHPLATSCEPSLVVYSLTQRKALGSIRLRDDDDVPYGFTTMGLHGPLAGHSKREAKKARSDEGARARALLLDDPPAEALGDAADEALDFEDRVAFWGTEVGEGRLAKGLDLSALVKASAGLTHLLPVALAHATSTAASAPARFGQTGADGSGPGEPSLLDALSWLAQKSDAERDVLFEDMLQKEIARETARTTQQQLIEATRKLPRPIVLLALALLAGTIVGLVAWLTQ